MILVDSALERLEREGRPVRVAMVGAGFMGRGIALQLLSATRGVRLVAIANRTVERAAAAYEQAGVSDVIEVRSVMDLDDAIEHGRPAVLGDALLVASAQNVDVVVEVTGTVELAARVLLAAIQNGKHVVLMNAEVDGTVGPILKRYADAGRVIYTNADGDQPGVLMNLYRFVSGIGVRALVCGNIKGLHDPYRDPTTQASFAERWGQNPRMVTSFADGTKISFEQAIVANATGMAVARRGMLGPSVEPGTHVRDAIDRLAPQKLLDGPGIVDYVVGAEPSPGVFVLGTHEDPTQKHYLELYKLGSGPFYCFYTPYHLCHFEVPTTIGRAACFGDATIAPHHGLRVEVVAAAKRDLEIGDELDGLGGYTVYGLADNATSAREADLLPIGLAEGARMKRPLARDDIVRCSDVELPAGRIVDRLRAEQRAAGL